MSIQDVGILVYAMLGITFIVEVYVFYLIISTNKPFQEETKDGNQNR